ncbi:MAG: lytic transglycosylase domain-containing protein, partial [Pseudomonadota bacterium]
AALCVLAVSFAAPANAVAQDAVCQPGPSEDQAFAQALVALEVRDYRRALTLAPMTADSRLADIVRWSSYADDSAPATFEQIVELIRRRPDWPNMGTLRLRAEKLLPANAAPAPLAAWFTQAPPQTFDGLMAFLGALRAIGDREEFAQTARSYWHDYPMRADQQTAFLALAGEYLDASDHWRRADRLVWQDSLAQADRVAALLPAGQQALIRARIALRDRTSGVDAAIERVPADLQTDEGLIYDRLRWRQRQGLDRGALEMLQRQPAEVRYARSWARVRMVLARDALEAGQTELAYSLAANHRQTSGVAYVGAEWLAGWIALHHLGKPGPAADHFARLLDASSTPISRSRGAYWLGEAWEAMGDREQAIRWWQLASTYPTAFYGQLAGQRLGQMTPFAPTETAMVAPAAGAHFGETGCLVLTLARLGAQDLAEPFLNLMARRSSTLEDHRALAGLSLAVGDMPSAVHAGKQLVNRNAWLPVAAYPQVNLPNFAGAPEPAISLAIIRQESLFDQYAVSRVGARGLMQLMPGTASDLARELGLAVSTADLTENPALNLRLGTEFLGQMLERFDGSAVLAMAAYNAGPTNANRWIRRFGDPRDPNIDVRHWIESIPFAETRNYVQRVLEATIVYRRLAGHGGGAAGIASLLDPRHPG